MTAALPSADAGHDALFFDLDGTLIDSEAGIVAGIGHALTAVGAAVPAREALRAWIGPPMRDSLALLFPDDPDRADRALAAYRAYYDRTGWREHLIYPGMGAAVRRLHEAGYRLAVVTSKSERYARRIVETLPFAAAFDDVIGASDDGARRYKRELIAEALRRLDLVASACRMIGDRRMDIEGARQHAMRSVGVLWGFGDATELRAAGADLLVESPTALLAALAVPPDDAPAASACPAPHMN